MNLANWRTTVWGGATILAAFISQNTNLVSALIPDGPQAKFIFSCIAAFTGFVTFANSKDRQVTGNGTVNEPTKVAQPDGSNKVIAPLVAFLLIPALFLSGCTFYEDVQAFQARPNVQKAEMVAGRIALDFLLSAAKTKANGGQFDSAWAIGAGLNSLADVVPTLTNKDAAAVIVNTAQAFSGDAITKPLAQKLAAAYVAANPQTPAEKSATVVALATGTTNGTATATSALP